MLLYRPGIVKHREITDSSSVIVCISSALFQLHRSTSAHCCGVFRLYLPPIIAIRLLLPKLGSYSVVQSMHSERAAERIPSASPLNIQRDCTLVDTVIILYSTTRRELVATWVPMLFIRSHLLTKCPFTNGVPAVAPPYYSTSYHSTVFDLLPVCDLPLLF